MAKFQQTRLPQRGSDRRRSPLVGGAPVPVAGATGRRAAPAGPASFRRGASRRNQR